MLTEQFTVDLINVLNEGQIEVRHVAVVFEDNVKIHKIYRRYCLMPGDDLSKEDARVIAAAQTAWTTEILSNWQKRQQQVPFLP